MTTNIRRQRSYRMHIACLMMVAVGLVIPPEGRADALALKFPIIDDSPELHRYFADLLTTALKAADQEVSLTLIRAPQLRIKRSLPRATSRFTGCWRQHSVTGNLSPYRWV